MNKINLPVFSHLKQDESTYYTFSRAMVDLDKSIANDTEYYFTKVVGIRLPIWNENEFYINDEINTNLNGINSTNPNHVIPSYFARYMENILRQDIDNPKLTEIAFWKTMKILDRTGLDIEQIINKTVKTINSVVISDFHEMKNNNGWCKVISHIPPDNKPINIKLDNHLIPVIQSNDQRDINALYDNSSNQFEFEGIRTINFDSIISSNESVEDFEINAFLLFYRDIDGVDKLHGINFIGPYENLITEYKLTNYPIAKNRTFGYQFVINIKTCNNEASKIHVLNNNEQVMWWNGFENTLGKLNEILDNQAKEFNKKLID